MQGAASKACLQDLDANPARVVAPAGTSIASDPWDAHARRQRFLTAALGCWLVMGLLALTSLPFFPTQTSFLQTIILVTTSSGLMVGAMLRLGWLQTASLAFCLVIDLTFFGLALMIHDQDSTSHQAIMTRVSCLALTGLAILGMIGLDLAVQMVRRREAA